MSPSRVITDREFRLLFGHFGDALRFVVNKNATDDDHGPDTGTCCYLVAEHLQIKRESMHHLGPVLQLREKVGAMEKNILTHQYREPNDKCPFDRVSDAGGREKMTVNHITRLEQTVKKSWLNNQPCH